MHSAKLPSGTNRKHYSENASSSWPAAQAIRWHVANALPETLRPADAVTHLFRKQAATGDLVLPGVTIHLLEGVHQNISATSIREAASKGKPLGKFLDPAVAEYIRKMGLYRDRH